MSIMTKRLIILAILIAVDYFSYTNYCWYCSRQISSTRIYESLNGWHYVLG